MSKRKRAHHQRHTVSMRETASFVCDYCQAVNYIPLDITGGDGQEYVEDCSVCCRPNNIRVSVDEEGRARERPPRRRLTVSHPAAPIARPLA